MLPTKNILNDCVFNDASDTPTIVKFIMDLGETMDCVDVNAVKTFTYEDFSAYHLVGLKKDPSRESVKISWGVTSYMII